MFGSIPHDTLRAVFYGDGKQQPITRPGTALIGFARQYPPTRKPHLQRIGGAWVCQCPRVARLGQSPGMAYAMWACATIPT